MTDPIRIRASSFGELLDCAHRFEAKHLLGMRMTTRGAQRMGTALHASTAAFDKARVLGSPISTNDAVSVFVDTLNAKEEDVMWTDGLRQREAEIIGGMLTYKYCADFSPKYEYVAVELTLKDTVIDCNNGVSILLTGTMDRARVFNRGGALNVADVKSGLRAVHEDGTAVTKGHGVQLGVYQFLAGETLEIPIQDPAYIIGMQTTKHPAIGVGEIHGARANLIGTKDTPGLLDFAADTLKTGMFRPNPSSRLCSEKFCPRWDTCRYHE